MNESQEQRNKAESEAKEVQEWINRECDMIQEKYKGQQGMDRGALEIKGIIQEGMRKIAAIRENYGIPERDIEE